jgi:RHS repeat-associated protein
MANQGTIDYESNSLNQYTIANSISLPQDAYDSDGNLRNGRLPASQTENSELTWDAENRLVEARVGTGGPLVSYAYDSQSRRIAKTVGADTTLYLYDGWNVIAEYNGAGLTKTYSWGMDLSGAMQGAGGVGGLLAVQSGSQIHYPTFDGNGNVSEYLNSAGIPAAHFEYDPFGNTVINTDTVDMFPYRFSTKPLDSETGLLYYGYRWYHPSKGRWLSRDPIGENGGINIYALVDNDSISNLDTLGLSSVGDKSDCVTRVGIDTELSMKEIMDKIKRFPKIGVGVSLTGDAGIRFSKSHEICKECCRDGSRKEIEDTKTRIVAYGELEATGGFIASRGDVHGKDADLLAIDSYVGVRGNITLSGGAEFHSYTGGCSTRNRNCSEGVIDLGGTLTAGGQIAGSFLGFEFVLARLEGGLKLDGFKIKLTMCDGEDIKFDADGPDAEWIWRVTILNVSGGGY